MEVIRQIGFIYLLIFALYHVFTGIISVFFPQFALKFYRGAYGFHAIENRQLILSLKPWGNLALAMGLVGFLLYFQLEKYKMVLYILALLLLIRIWYRVFYYREIHAVLSVTLKQNISMIVIQFMGVCLFLFLAVF